MIRTEPLPLCHSSVRGTRHTILFLLVIPLFLYVALLPVMPLMEPDEARYSDIASMMNRSGDYVTPRLNHVVYLEKPPLAYWVTALFFKIFGENDFSSRLFSGFSAWGCILLVYCIGAFLYGEKSGLYSSAVFSTFLYVFLLGRLNILDIPLTFFVSLAIWGGYRFFAENTRRNRWIYLFYFSSALAFLTKGLIGIIFPPAIVGLFLVTQKRWRDIFKLLYLPGILLFLAMASPWIILVQRANKNFLWTFLIEEHFLRYATDAYGRANVFYYLPFIVLGTIPWLAFFIQIFWKSVKKREFILKIAEQRFLLIWSAFIFLFFSISSAKMITYLAPVFLPLAVIFGHAFRNHEEEKDDLRGQGARGIFRRLPVVAQSLKFLVLLSAIPFLKRHAVPSGEWWPLAVVPILVLALTVLLPDIVYNKWRRGWFLTVYLLSAILLGSIVFPLSHYLTPYKSSFPVAQAIKEFLPADHELYQYRIYLRGIDFYSKIRTPIVGRADELQTKKQSLPPGERDHYFVTKEMFYEICKQNGGLYCITQGTDKYKELKENIPHVRVIWKNSTFYLLYLAF
jgi:4-amino-4-deoxy-L-arabinose transferase-like glycosyltransferase